MRNCRATAGGAGMDGNTSMAGRIKDNALYVTLKEAKKALVRRLKLRQFLGNKFRCPVCGTRLNAFKPIWKSYLRKTAETGYVYPLSQVETFNYQAYSCPACDCSDRERLYTLFFEKEFTSFDQHRRYRLVEFAPSIALQKQLRAYPFIEYRSADLFRQSVDDNVDITDMKPYADNSVDIFICSHILEHVPDDRKAMRELFRKMKPGGFGITMVPIIHGVDETQEDLAINTPALRWKFYGLDDHLRQYGKADFIRRLQAAGFQVEQLDIKYFGAAAFEHASIAADSVLYVVRKPQ